MGVQLHNHAHDSRFVCEDNGLWISPGETVEVGVSHTDGISVTAWNSADKEAE